MRLYESSREALEHKTRYFIIYRKQCLTVLIGSLCAVALSCQLYYDVN